MNEVNQNIVEFLKKVADDEELQAKMQKATNPDEAYAIASAVQDGFTKEEFVETMQAINAQTDKELSEDDLAQVAGGSFWDDFKKSMSVVTKISSKITGIAGKAAAA
jgi:predicted ribosomally synthesized peptide with nif11-like leader